MSQDNVLKYLGAEIKEVDEKDRTFTVVGSKEVVDADGDIVKIDGMDLKRFKNNPVVLPYHSYSGFPIGKAVGKKVWVDDKKLMFKIQLATAEENPLAEQAYRLIKGGYLKTFSIGFIPDYTSIEYPEKHAKGARRIINKAELLEISLVAVPSNPEAMLASINKAWDDGTLDGEELADWEEMLDNMPKEETPTIFDMELFQKFMSLPEGKKAIEDNTNDKEDLIKALREAECKIAELELLIKEQDIDEEIEESGNDYLSEIFSLFNTQANSDESSADVEQTDVLTVEDALNILNEEKE